MSPSLDAAVAALAVLLLLRPPPRPHRSRRRRTDATRSRARLPASVAPALAGVATAVVLGGPVGLLTGVVVAAVGVRTVGRLEPAPTRRRRDLLTRQAPLVVDLVAACLRAGAPLERSLEVSSRAVGAPTAEVLARATASLRLGVEPTVVWAEVAQDEPLAGLARAVARSAQTGAPLAGLLPRVADQARATQRARAEARIRTASVRLTGPLGLAFLPAFVLLGVVPVVASWVGLLV